MALTPGDTDGVMSGTTPVDLVPSPAGSAKRVVNSVIVYNADTAAVTLTVRKTNTTGPTHRVIDKVTLQPGESYHFGVDGERAVLDGTTKKITGLLSGAPATTQPDWSSSWGDAT